MNTIPISKAVLVVLIGSAVLLWTLYSKWQKTDKINPMAMADLPKLGLEGLNELK